MILNVGQDVCQIDFWIEVVEFGCFDNGQDIGDVVVVLIRVCKELVFLVNFEWVYCFFSNVVIGYVVIGVL